MNTCVGTTMTQDDRRQAKELIIYRAGNHTKTSSSSTFSSVLDTSTMPLTSTLSLLCSMFEERKDVCSMLRSKHDWLFHFISQHIWNKQQKKNERNSRENICHDHIITEALPIRSPIANQYRSKRPAYNTRSTRNSEQKCRLYYSEQQANLGCFKPYLDTRILWYHDHLPT